jgi:hypothetical protein
MLDPTPELPDETPIDRVRFPTRIQNVLAAAGLDRRRGALQSFHNFSKTFIAHLRETLGLPLCDRAKSRWCNGCPQPP